MGLNKAQRRIAHLPHDVYKAYDINGRLLYVGISVNVFARMKEHKQYAGWMSAASRIDVVRYADRASAQAVEAICIRDDAPVFNVTRESTRGRSLPTVSLESFVMRQDADGWWIDE